MAADQGTVNRFTDRIIDKSSEIVRLMAELSLDLEFYDQVIGGFAGLETTPPSAANANISPNDVAAIVNVFTYIRTTYTDNKNSLWKVLSNVP